MKQSCENVVWTEMYYHHWHFHLGATAKGLCYVTLPNENYATFEKWAYKHHFQIHQNAKAMEPYVRELMEYFDGERVTFTVPLDLRGTPFQLRVWQMLRQIPYGETRSYSDLASSIGAPTATRAVASANGANPLPIMVPCHRVIGKTGALRGYRGGIEVKQALLEHERYVHRQLRETSLFVDKMSRA